MRTRKSKEEIMNLFAVQNSVTAKEIKVGDLEYGCLRYSIGRNMMKNIAAECGAVIHIGRLWRFDVEKVDSYFANLTE